MQARDKITYAQYAAVVFVGLFSPITRLLPKTVVQQSGTSGWMAPIVAYLPMLAYLALAIALIRCREEGEGLADLINRALGKWVGGAFNIVSALWLSAYGGFVIRSGVERLLSALYTGAQMGFFIITLTAICTLTALGELRWQARTAQIFLLVLILVIGSVLLFSLPNIRLEYIWPPTPSDAKGVALGAIPVVNVMTPMMYMAFLAGGATRSKNIFKKSVVWLSVTTVMIMMINISAVGIIGPELSKSIQYPFFVMLRSITIFKLLEQIEPLIIVVWLVTDYVFVSMLISSSAEAARSVLHNRKKAVTVLPSAVIVAVVAFFVAHDAFQYETVSRNITPALNLIYTVAVLPIIFIIGILRKKLKVK